MAVTVRNVGEVRRGIPLNEGTLLSRETRVASPIERVYRECLLDLGIRTHYAPLSFKIGDSGGIVYTPDFVLSQFSIGGRQVLLEPHSFNFSREDNELNIRKFVIFKRNYGALFHLIISSDMNIDVANMRFPVEMGQLSNEYWEMPSNDRNSHYERTRGSVLAHLKELTRRAFREERFLATGTQA